MSATAPHRVGVYLAFVQFLFTLSWTVYVIFLPQLAAQAGIAKQWVVWIILADQLVFAAMDYATGVAADRVARALGRLGYLILGMTLVSCAGFLLLPYIAPAGSPTLLLLVIAVWAVTSSALRAPPLVLIGKYAAAPSIPWLSGLSLFGLGLAGAVSPYLTVLLRDLDPRLPFVVTSLALAAATIGIVWAERTLRGPQAAPQQVTARGGGALAGFLAAVLLLGLAFQVHFSLNSARLFLRHAQPGDLPYLMPVFWVGFNVCMLPATLATRRYGGAAVAAAGALAAALGAAGALQANEIRLLVASQFVAGAGWGCVLMSIVTAAIALGRSGREGRALGGLFAFLALAAFLRILALATELNKDPEIAALLAWVPVAGWAAAALILLALIARSGRTTSAQPARADARLR